MKLPIPDDWNEAEDGYTLGLVCIPNSKLWRAIVRGQIQILSYGRLWDEQTGRIKDVQVIGKQIYESFMTDCLGVFDDINLNLASVVAKLDAINTSLQALNLSATVNIDTAALVDGLEAISDGITAQTTVIETRSGAEVVAQTTNFNSLIASLASMAARISPADANNIYAAISALELVANCSPDVSYSPTINVTCDSGLGGSEPPAEEGTEGGTPPEGMEDPPVDPGYDRKCRVANMIIDSHIYVLDQFITHDVVGLAELGIAICAATVAYILGLPGAVALAKLKDAIGAIADVVLVLLEEGLDLASLKARFENNRQDLVCGLYTSTTAAEARQSILDVLDAAGANAAELALISIMFTNKGANNLFFSGGSISEAMLDGYTGTIDCEVCGPIECPEMVLFLGNMIDTYSAQSEVAEGGSQTFVAGWFNYDTQEEIYCTPTNPTVSGMVITNNTPGYTQPWNIWVQRRDGSTIFNNNVSQGSYPAIFPTNEIAKFEIRTTFNIGADFTVEWIIEEP